MEYQRCYAVISLPAIYHNLQNVRARLPEGTSLMAVVKANAYGHGSVSVAPYVEEIVDLFGVACLEEALELRSAGITKPILILGYTSPSQYESLIRNDVRAAIYDEKDAESLSECAAVLGKTARIHIAADTGMTRIGFRSTGSAADAIVRIADLPGIMIEGLFTHLSCADMVSEEAVCYTDSQLEEYDELLKLLTDRGVAIPMIHAYNSAAIMHREDRGYTCFRSGIVTYGLYPSDEVDKARLPLQPALSWIAHVIHVADVEESRGVGYGATYVTRGPMRIATVSAGYADGYPRALSGKGRVLIHGQYAPILGRVCMDQFMVDVSHIVNVKKEDEVVLIGSQGTNSISADEIASIEGTINYEITCKISPRVFRKYERDI